LREEVAALRARLNALTTLPLSVSDPLPLQAELDVAAKTPPRQMPLFGPVHGPPLPRVDHGSSLQAKVGLYRTLFAGRSDVYAYRWENSAEGTKGWAPKRRRGTTRDNPEYLPLTDEVISAHLTKENPAACGLYVTLPDSTCCLLVCDFDGGTWRLDAAAYAEAAAWAGVPAAVEISRSLPRGLGVRPGRGQAAVRLLAVVAWVAERVPAHAPRSVRKKRSEPPRTNHHTIIMQ
jgi:hypothetical protein